MTAFQIKDQIEQHLHEAITAIQEARDLMEEALTNYEAETADDENDVNTFTEGLNETRIKLRDLYNQVNDLPLPDGGGMDEATPGESCSHQAPAEPEAATTAAAITGANSVTGANATIIGQIIGMNEAFVARILAEKDRQIEQLMNIIQESHLNR